jgi:AraC family transcriptional regulator
MDTEVFSRGRGATIEDRSMPTEILESLNRRCTAAVRAVSIDELRYVDESTPSSAANLMNAVSALIDAVDCALTGDPHHARSHLCEASASLGAATNAESSAATEQRESEKCRGGLAPWQIRRVATHIEEHLGESIQCVDLSALTRLSLSHFMRAFRDSFGCPPHAFLMKRRMERAQGLMLATSTPLGQIALECGLADQSHLSRLFQRFVGESPAAWRRARTPLAYCRR